MAAKTKEIVLTPEQKDQEANIKTFNKAIRYNKKNCKSS